MSQDEARSVVDTVVLRYFLLVDEADLLVRLLGEPILMPTVVFDPGEGDIPEAARSELTRSVAYQRRVAADEERSREERDGAHIRATRLDSIRDLDDAGVIAAVDLTAAELSTMASLTDPARARGLGLTFGLDLGEAACLALAMHRDLVVATDDSDALTALEAMSPGHPYERIRRLLVRAAAEELISEEEANRVHREMAEQGFWDSTPPFPSAG